MIGVLYEIEIFIKIMQNKSGGGNGGGGHPCGTQRTVEYKIRLKQVDER